MELKLSIRADEELLCATYSGKFSLAEAQETFLQIIEGIQQHKLQKILVDGRAITGEPSTLERFLYGEFAAEKVMTLRIQHALFPRFAYVLIPPVLDLRRLGENVAVNRGMVIKTFENLDNALQWLGIDQGNNQLH